MRVSFALVVWGDSYVQDFLEFSLPSLLADGNLTGNPVIDGSRFQVLTTKRDFERLTASPLFQRLQHTLPVEFVEIEQPHAGDKYHMVSRYQMEAIRRSEDFDAITLLYPDIIWARGAIRYAVEQLAQGALAFLSPGPTVLPEPARAALTALAKMEGPAGAQSIAIEPQQLAGIVLDHYHPMWDGFDWDGNAFTSSPACLRWDVPGQGWLIRCFHLHPVVMRMQRDNPMFFSEFNISLDAEYVARLFDGTDRLSFATDTSDFAIVSVRGGDSPPFPNPGGRSSVTTVARWAESYALLLHRAFANVAFRWHRGNADETAWWALELRSQKIIDEVRDRLHTPDLVLRAEDPTAYRARKQRRRSANAWRAPRIGLPPSRANRSRSELSKMLIYKMSYGALWRMAILIREGALGRQILRYPFLVRLWQRIKPALRPKSEMDAAISSRSLLRRIMHQNAGDDKSA